MIENLYIKYIYSKYSFFIKPNNVMMKTLLKISILNRIINKVKIIFEYLIVSRMKYE